MPGEPQTSETAEWANIEEEGGFLGQGKESDSQTFEFHTLVKLKKKKAYLELIQIVNYLVK